MKRSKLILFQLFLSSIAISNYISLNAQTFSVKYGVIGAEEFNLKECPFDKGAEAIVLFDIGKSYFERNAEGGFDVIFERATRIKIFNEAGLKWAEAGIPYYREGNIFEKVFDIEGTTYNWDEGLKKTELDKTAFFDETINQYWMEKKFAMPNVKAGSIIEYRYKISSQYLFNFRDWEFQNSIPTIYSAYQTKMIPFYEYSFLLQGSNKLDIQNSYLEKGIPHQFGSITFYNMVYDFGMKAIPAFKDEQFIASRNDYILKIDFQLSKIHYPDGHSKDILTTWPALIKDLQDNEDFGKYIKKSQKEADDLIDMESLGSLSMKDKFDEVVSFVKANYSWNKINSEYAHKSIKDFLKEKTGSSGNINLFLTGLLNAAGIESYPVIMSTRSNGKIKYDYPYNHFFNYVIVAAKIDDKYVLTDATDVLCPNDKIPPRCINDRGLIINDSKDEGNWLNLNTNPLSVTNCIYEIEIDNDKQITNINKSYTLYEALAKRKNWGDNPSSLKEEFKNKHIAIVDTSVLINNYNKVKEPYKVGYSVIDNYEMINDKIYIEPFLHDVMDDNPFKQESRNYPIDFTYPFAESYSAQITIPEDYSLDYIPEDKTINNDDFGLTYKTLVNDNNITVTLSYNLDKSVYSAVYYKKLKYLFDEIVKKGNDRIVLVKNSTVTMK